MLVSQNVGYHKSLSVSEREADIESILSPAVNEENFPILETYIVTLSTPPSFNVSYESQLDLPLSSAQSHVLVRSSSNLAFPAGMDFRGERMDSIPNAMR